MSRLANTIQKKIFLNDLRKKTFFNISNLQFKKTTQALCIHNQNVILENS